MKRYQVRDLTHGQRRNHVIALGDHLMFVSPDGGQSFPVVVIAKPDSMPRNLPLPYDAVWIRFVGRHPGYANEGWVHMENLRWPKFDEWCSS